MPCCRVKGYLHWSPQHREAVLAPLQNKPDADDRAQAYREMLEWVPPDCEVAVNDIVPWMLRRTRNERAVVRKAVSARPTFWWWSSYTF